MSSKSMTARGTKRRCQSADCGLPFYDLNRTEMDCPMCGAAFDLALATRVFPAAAARGAARKPSRYFPAAAPIADAATDTIDPVDAVEVELEADDDTGAEVATVETILEEDDDDPADEIVDVIPEVEDRPDE